MVCLGNAYKLDSGGEGGVLGNEKCPIPDCKNITKVRRHENRWAWAWEWSLQSQRIQIQPWILTVPDTAPSLFFSSRSRVDFWRLYPYIPTLDKNTRMEKVSHRGRASRSPQWLATYNPSNWTYSRYGKLLLSKSSSFSNGHIHKHTNYRRSQQNLPGNTGKGPNADCYCIPSAIYTIGNSSGEEWYFQTSMLVPTGQGISRYEWIKTIIH